MNGGLIKNCLGTFNTVLKYRPEYSVGFLGIVGLCVFNGNWQNPFQSVFKVHNKEKYF